MNGVYLRDVALALTAVVCWSSTARSAEKWSCEMQMNKGKTYKQEWIVSDDRMFSSKGTAIYRVVLNNSDTLLATDDVGSLIDHRSLQLAKAPSVMGKDADDRKCAVVRNPRDFGGCRSPRGRYITFHHCTQIGAGFEQSHPLARYCSHEGVSLDVLGGVENSVAKAAGKVPDHLRSELSLRVHPQDWLAKARELKKAADLLFIEFENEQLIFNEEFEKDSDTELPRPDDSVVTMLLGFAVENLLKGLLVSTLEHVEGVKDLSELPPVLRRHELKPIACVVKHELHIEFSQEELDLLDALTHVILWYGRYPSARNIDDLIPLDETRLASPTGLVPGDDQPRHPFRKFMFDYPHDYFATLKLYDRLEAILQNQSQQPKGPT